LTLSVDTVDFPPRSDMGRPLSTDELFATHPVFSLAEATEALAPPGGRAGTVARLKHHLASGRLRRVARELYAVVPHGLAPGDVRPDPFLLAAAARPDAVLSHHAALELLGAAHSVWSECTAYTARPRRALALASNTIRFLAAPAAMTATNGKPIGTRRVERLGRVLTTTGPERTLVEGFQRPRFAGGLEELLQSAAGFAVLDLVLLHEVLTRYAIAQLWAATGWFLERTRATFHVSDEVLERHEQHSPRSPHYLARGRRGGTLERRWNLIVPDELRFLGGPDDR
jgi:predicted transcriptional regulator of viral defense system